MGVLSEGGGPLADTPLFVEMAVFQRNNRGVEQWSEQARWVKYEEDIEEGGQRWSKPFVPTVSLSALYDLRKVLESAEVNLQYSCDSEERACRDLVDRWAKSGVITDGDRTRILQTLLRPHVHLYEKSAKLFVKKKQNDPPTPVRGERQQRYRRSSVCSVVYMEPDKTDKDKNVQFLRKIPHDAECVNVMVGQLPQLKAPVGALLRLRDPVVLGNIAEVPLPTRFLFVLLAPQDMNHVEVGRAVGTLFTDPDFRRRMLMANSKEEILSSLDNYMHTVSVLPPATWDPTMRLEPPAPTTGGGHSEGSENGDEGDDVLARTGKPFGGLFRDIKRKLPWYLSDFKDGLSVQCLATWLFLYFACLTPLITFGGLMGIATSQAMGTMETMVASCVCGVGFALFSGQPLLILGSTGPVLVFEKILVHTAHSFELDYLEFRVWVGVWIAGILFILVATDASSIVRYITRFTEDNFATLIALIFMVEAFKNVFLIRHGPSPKSMDNMDMLSNHSSMMLDEAGNFTAIQPEALTQDAHIETPIERQAIFLMSLLLFFGTFFLAYMLKEFRMTSYFPAWVRYLVSDFAVILAIAAMTSMDFFTGINTPKLAVPEKFAPTSPNRGWVISPFGKNPFWTIFAAAVPAFLATILIFMDQQITAVIINRKDNKLKKGCGFHLDLFVLACLITLNSFMGLPWFVAATVESLTNLNSLKMETESAAPGEKPGFLGVREQRLSNVMVFCTVGLSVFLTPVLRNVPMPVLYGVFLYMGYSAIMRMELFHRILLFLMPVKYQPDYRFLREVPLLRVHMFTLVQVLCLALLWVIKSVKTTSILFPLMLVVMMVVRKALDHVFTQPELKALDDLLPGAKEKHKKSSIPPITVMAPKQMLGSKQSGLYEMVPTSDNQEK